jgi:hypothetical protein
MGKPNEPETRPCGEQPVVTTRRARFGPDPLPRTERVRLAAWSISSILAKTALVMVLIIVLLTVGPKLRLPRELAAVMPAYLARFFESEPEQTFGVGSAKEHVRAVQGPPSFETDQLWRYGASEVYFAGGRVIGWRSAGPNALKAR